MGPSRGPPPEERPSGIPKPSDSDRREDCSYRESTGVESLEG